MRRIIYLFCLFFLSSFSTNSNDHNQLIKLWPNRSHYYESDLYLTLKDILERNPKCLLNSFVLPPNQIQLPKKENQIYITEITASQKIITQWKEMKRPTHMRSDPNLCDPPRPKEKPKKKQYPFFNHSGCQITGYQHDFAPRCQKPYLKWICDRSKKSIYDRTTNYFVVPDADHQNIPLPPQPWLVIIRQALVSRCGVISYQCGYAHASVPCLFRSARDASCSLSRLSKADLSLLRNGNSSINSTMACRNKVDTPIEYHKRVFVVAEWDDTHLYHTELEVLPMIIYHKDFLIANPDIKIMFGCNWMKNSEVVFRSSLNFFSHLFPLIGISMDRFVVHRDVYADEIYLPRYGGCQDPVYNTWEILTMRDFFYEQLALNGSHSGSNETEQERKKEKKPVILLLSRSPKSKFSRNKGDPVRVWSVEFTNRFLEQLQVNFPSYEVRLLSDRDEEMMTCFLCQMRAFSEADILIGIHGAGFANQIFMKPNSVVMEICPFGNDGRCYLGGGPFSRAAFVLSHNYLVHHPLYEEFVWIKQSSEFNLSRLIEHLRSFLSGMITIK